jgi:hypothetical protein
VHIPWSVRRKLRRQARIHKDISVTDNVLLSSSGCWGCLSNSVDAGLVCLGYVNLIQSVIEHAPTCAFSTGDGNDCQCDIAFTPNV